MSLIKQPLYPPDRQPHVTAERQAAHAAPTRVTVRLSSCSLLCSSFPPPCPPITQPYREYISHWIHYETIMAEIISKQTWQWPKPQMATFAVDHKLAEEAWESGAQRQNSCRCWWERGSCQGSIFACGDFLRCPVGSYVLLLCSTPTRTGFKICKHGGGGRPNNQELGDGPPLLTICIYELCDLFLFGWLVCLAWRRFYCAAQSGLYFPTLVPQPLGH